ncbi:MAG: hypothetical protein HQK98_05270 [Nitrospirae bacterium]|nr:hypothetical protein [Nitrospirota bacterium]
MKNIRALIMIAAIVLAVGIAVMAFAESKMFTLLDNATAGDNTTINIPYKVYQNWACEVKISGHPDNATIFLGGNVSGGDDYGSFGNDIYTQLPRYALDSGFYIFSIQNRPVKTIHAEVASMSGGVNPRMSMVCLGVE